MNYARINTLTFASEEAGNTVQAHYVETAAAEPPPKVPPQWALHREKVSGGVAYRLFNNERAEVSG